MKPFAGCFVPEITGLFSARELIGNAVCNDMGGMDYFRPNHQNTILRIDQLRILGAVFHFFGQFLPVMNGRGTPNENAALRWSAAFQFQVEKNP
ncbi:hypothetical protein ACHFJ0_02020 [Paracoccus sp. NGMCC 1.201697]|uniref:Uncharacterized protein n=1 Tax=Paracoccus broussonetiae subsp. drimophilus TaxID=3373869 RepID=A0ABW7LFI7_9RHOB